MTGLGALLALAVAAPAPLRSYAVVVGNNRGLDPANAPLRYADDDAVRYAELLAPGVAGLRLLTVLDRDTQAQHPDLALQAVPPTRAALLQALSEIDRALAEDAAQGRRTQLFFVFVGHGGIGPGGEGYVSLLDSRFTRADLFREVVARSPATFNHLVVDACDSYYLVSSRGSGAADERGPDRSEALRRYLSDEELDAHPNTGAIVSTSGDRESHEWSVYQGGIFTHALVSALLGAGDVNGDGIVDYSEVAAFLQAASAAVADPAARLEVFVRPPSQALSIPLWRLAFFPRFARLGPDAEGPFHLEAPDGSRAADFDKPRGSTLVLGLSERRGRYRLAQADREADLPEGPLVADPGQWRDAPVAARADLAGPLERGLFRVPFGAPFYEGFVAAGRRFVPVAMDAPPFVASFPSAPPELPLKDPFSP